MRRLGVLSVMLAGCEMGLPATPGADSRAANDGATTSPVGVAAGDLPCDIEALVRDVCIGCHGRPPGGGAPVSLITYDDWTAKKATGTTYAAIALARMQDPVSPMPPKPAAPAAPTQIDAVRAFVSAGYPRTGCGSGGLDAAGSPSATVVCTSGQYWAAGDTGQSGLMQPGRACIACHRSQKGEPKIDFGGTVYPTFHEPDLCYGTKAGGTVTVTDATGAAFSASINANGNFLVQAGTGATPPFRAKVSSGGRESNMVGAVPTGDCNSCHTAGGASGAPGRIRLP